MSVVAITYVLCSKDEKKDGSQAKTDPMAGMPPVMMPMMDPMAPMPMTPPVSGTTDQPKK